MDLFDYNEKIDSFVINLIKDILKHVRSNGFPDEHHLYITFNTLFPGVQISDALLLQYPEAMTIVLQYQYYDLKVEKDFFSVKLSFNGALELLVIPFNALLFIRDLYDDFSFTFLKKEIEISPLKQTKLAKTKKVGKIKTKVKKITFTDEKNSS